MNITHDFARWCAALSFETLPYKLILLVKAAILDYFAVSLVGCKNPNIKFLENYVLSQYSNGPSTVIGREIQLSPEGAALLNGAIAHWEDFDDANFSMSGHPSVIIFPALIAIGESVSLSGKDFITAYTAAFEVSAKLGLFVNPQQIRLGWHPTATLGAIGAAVASAKALKLDPRKTEIAIGIAATQSFGLRVQFGTMVKPLHAGLAGRAGVLAATLSNIDFDGTQGILEHNFGFINAFSGGNANDCKDLDKRIGNPYEILSSGIAFKRFPSNFQTQSGIMAVLDIVQREKFSVDDILKIRCKVNHLMKYSLKRHRPRNALEAKQSLPFCLALAILDHDVKPDQFNESRVNDPKILGLFDRVEIETHPDMSNLNMTDGQDFLSMEVDIELTNGKVFSSQIKNDIGLPATNDKNLSDELCNKFLQCSKELLPYNQATQVINMVKNIENIKNIGEILVLLGQNITT